MSHTIFSFELGRAHLVMTLKNEFTVDDIVDRISTPSERVIGATARTSAAAPLIRENHFATVVVEGGRVPVGKACIGRDINALWASRITDVEQDSVTGAGARSEL